MGTKTITSKKGEKKEVPADKKLKKHGSAINAFMNTHWAIASEEILLDILSLITDSYEAFFDIDGKETPVNIEGTHGKINVKGVIFKYSNLLTMLGLGTSTESINRQIDDMLAAGVKTIDFIFDTPGGQVSGTNSTSERIYSLRGKIETNAIVNGQCCSAGIWLATACENFSAGDETDILGSIGVMLTVPKKDAEYEVEIISSNAPLKNPDPETKDGYDAYLSVVNQLESIFIETVARNRNTDEKVVKETYGKGGIMVARDALAVGMIDDILTNGGNMKVTVDMLKSDHKSVVDELVTEATSEFKTQVESLQNENAQLKEDLDAVMAERAELETKIENLTPEDAKLPKAVKDQIASLEKNLIESKLKGFPEEFVTAMTGLQGLVTVDKIVGIASAVESMKKVINSLGQSMGKEGDDSDSLTVDQKAEKLEKQYISEGMSKYEAHKLAYREASKK